MGETIRQVAKEVAVHGELARLRDRGDVPFDGSVPSRDVVQGWFYQDEVRRPQLSRPRSHGSDDGSQ